MLDKLSEGREVSLYGFSQSEVSLDRDELPSVSIQGDETALGAALSAALAEHRGQPLAGVLVISDGQSNAGEDARKAAEQAGKQSVPVMSLAVGTIEGPSNARLAAIEADPVVFVRDPAEIGVLVEGHGLQGAPAPSCSKNDRTPPGMKSAARKSSSTKTRPASASNFMSSRPRWARSTSAHAWKTWASN